jgi:hypothetical protein
MLPTTAREMWEKAGRELSAFDAAPSVDAAINFFLTVAHIREYAVHEGKDVASMDADADFQLCVLVSNTVKHHHLTHKTMLKLVTERSFGGGHADAAQPHDEVYAILADGARFPVSPMGRAVLWRWKDLLGI